MERLRIQLVLLSLLTRPGWTLVVPECPDLYESAQNLLQGENNYTVAATLYSFALPPFNKNLTGATTTWSYWDWDRTYHVRILSNSITQDSFQVKLFKLRTEKFYQKFDSGAGWLLYLLCKEGHIAGMLGVAKKVTNEEESRNVLGPWLESLKLTKYLSVHDFYYMDSRFSGDLHMVTETWDCLGAGLAVIILALVMWLNWKGCPLKFRQEYR